MVQRSSARHIQRAGTNGREVNSTLLMSPSRSPLTLEDPGIAGAKGPKQVKDLYTENHQRFLKELKATR